MDDFLDADDELLTPRPVEVSHLLRDRLRRQTARHVAARLWLRRAGMVAVMAACFVGGLLTMRLAAPAVPPAVEDDVVVRPTMPPDPEPSSPPSPAPVVEQHASLVDESARVGLYRLAGDRYLSEEQDPAAALRCYTRMLDAAAEADLEIAPEDSWLLIALKDARTREKRDAKNVD